MSNSTLATVFGTLGTVFWCIQLVPQIWFNWRRKSCEGFPPFMMVLWIASGVPFGAYFLNQKESTLPLQLQPQIFMGFCSVALCQALVYPPVNWSLKKSVLSLAVFLALCAGSECALVFPIRPLVEQGTTWPNLIIGIFASVLLGLGLIPPYFELWKHKGRAIGFNFVFLAMDSSGAIFSLIAVAFQEKLDILGLILYIVVLILEGGIFLSHFIWWIRVKYFGLVPVELADDSTNQTSYGDDEKHIGEEVSQESLGTPHRENSVEFPRVLPVVDPIKEINDLRDIHEYHQAHPRSERSESRP